MVTVKRDVKGRFDLRDATQRFLEKVSLQENGCWRWTGATNDGYGIFWADGRNYAAHRWLYESLKGPISEGLQLDHLCRDRACVNPDHLEPVSGKVNISRGMTGKRDRSNRWITHCKRGHELTSDTVFVYRGQRKGCKICRAENVKRYAFRSKKNFARNS